MSNMCPPTAFVSCISIKLAVIDIEEQIIIMKETPVKLSVVYRMYPARKMNVVTARLSEILI